MLCSLAPVCSAGEGELGVRARRYGVAKRQFETVAEGIHESRGF